MIHNDGIQQYTTNKCLQHMTENKM